MKDLKTEISDFGRVKSVLGIISYGTIYPNGYMNVSVNNVNYAVHVLVCWAFNGKQPTAKHSVDHKNQIKDDNRKENLKWATLEEQADNNNANAKPINVYKDGKLMGKYRSQEFARKELNLGRCNISTHIKRNTTSKIGYTFKFA